MTQIFLEGSEVDVDKGFSTILSFAIDDIRNPGDRVTSFSKTVILPGTSRNNRLFGHIFRPEGANDYNPALANLGPNFNAAKAAACVVFQDNMQVLKGVLRIIEIGVTDGVPEYEVAISGELTGLAFALGGKKLEDLNWADTTGYDVAYGFSNAIASWANVGTGAGLVYPHIDYGGYSINKHDWNWRTFRPALHVYDYITRIFKEANFRVDCALFETIRFKSWLVPFNRKTLTYDATNLLDLSSEPNSNVLDADGGILGPTSIEFGTGFLEQHFTEIGSGVYQWSGGTQAITFYVGLDGDADSITPMQIALYKNGTLLQTILGPGTHLGPFIINFFSTPQTIATGDTIEVKAEFIGTPTPGIDQRMHLNTVAFQVFSATPVQIPYEDGNTLNLRDLVPRNVLQKDFLSSILKHSNLYVVEDRWDSRKLIVTPYPDFYSTDSSNAVDWTYKVDRSKRLSFKPLSEVAAKIYKFNFKQDSDYWNDLYQKRYGEAYGSRTEVIDFDFSNETSTVDIIFAGTPIVGYAGEDKIYSTIFKRNGANEEQTDSVIRIVQAKVVTGVSSWNLLADGGSVIDTRTDYCYAGHLDDPDAPTNDINFGTPKELFFGLAAGGLNTNQFNIYWSPYMAEITDKDSKLLTCTVYLTARDIMHLDFSKYVHIDGVLYRLKSISDYNASEPDTCKVELLKVINTLY